MAGTVHGLEFKLVPLSPLISPVEKGGIVGGVVIWGNTADDTDLDGPLA